MYKRQALSGTLRAGSWLVLLTPPFADWPTQMCIRDSHLACKAFRPVSCSTAQSAASSLPCSRPRRAGNGMSACISRRLRQPSAAARGRWAKAKLAASSQSSSLSIASATAGSGADVYKRQALKWHRLCNNKKMCI